MPEINFMRRILARRVEEPADPVTVEREVYEKLYGEPSTDITVTEVSPEPAARTGQRATPRRAQRPAAPSRVVG